MHYFPYDVKLRLLAHSRSFLANQKVRNAIVGAENLLIKIIQVYERYDGANKMQIEQHCVKLFQVQCREIGNNKHHKEKTELEKWQSEISPEY